MKRSPLATRWLLAAVVSSATASADDQRQAAPMPEATDEPTAKQERKVQHTHEHPPEEVKVRGDKPASESASRINVTRRDLELKAPAAPRRHS